MASLEARAYLLEVDEALQGRLDDAERKRAVREVRRVLQDMAFDYAARKRRPDPTDLDYALALHGLKPPEAVADHLASLRPRYRREKNRSRLRTGVLLVVLIVAGIVLANAMAGQVSHQLLHYTDGVPADQIATRSDTRNFTVPQGMDRLDYDISVLFHSPKGSIRITLLDPSNHAVYQRTWTEANGPVSVHGSLHPTPGNWTLVVDYQGTSGSARVDISGIGPRGP